MSTTVKASYERRKLLKEIVARGKTAGTKMQEAQARKALTLNPESVSRLSIAMSNAFCETVFWN